jgi:hypothetical protein
MTQSSVPDSGHEKEARLPRRDWLLLAESHMTRLCSPAWCGELRHCRCRPDSGLRMWPRKSREYSKEARRGVNKNA